MQNQQEEYAVDMIVGHDVITRKTLYCVRWYGHSARDGTIHPAVHISQNITAS